jgi:hypothetical protein
MSSVLAQHLPALNPAGLVAGRGLPDHPKSQVRRGRGNQHFGAFEGDRRVKPAKQGRAATQQDRDHVHADLIDQAERECLLHDGRAVQTDDLVNKVLTRAGALLSPGRWCEAAGLARGESLATPTPRQD